MSGWVQAIAAILTLVLLGALILITRRYLRTAEQLVRHAEAAAAESSLREHGRRRRMAVLLQAAAERTRATCISCARQRALPGNATGEGLELAGEAARVLQLAMDVGAGLEAHALEAQRYIETWRHDGSAAVVCSDPDRSALAASAVSSLANAADALELVEQEARRFLEAGAPQPA